MGVLQRFERRLEGLVEGAFARVFGGVVQPAEVAGALQREAADKKQVLAQGRVLVPNSFTVEVGATDLERFGEWDAQLRRELAGMVAEHAQEHGWSFVGPVQVDFEQVDELATGMFRVRSTVVADAQPAPRPPAAEPAPYAAPPAAAPVRPAPPAAAAQVPAPPARAPRPALPYPRLVITGKPDRVVPLTRPVTRIGRGVDADLRLPDTGVSRVHAEVRLSGDVVRVVDLDSTNGTSVNGQRVRESDLVDGDRLDIGATALVYRSVATDEPR